jgi:riboflavin transporter FmnP
MRSMDAKRTAFVAVMSAMGLLLSTISLNVAPWLGTVGQSGAALDLSHIATFIAAVFGGPWAGASVGFLSGIYAGYYFGYVMGTLGLLSLIGVPAGKALTGLTAGILCKKLRVKDRSRSSIITSLLVLASYVPECVFTVAYFLYIVTFVYGKAMEFMIPLVIPKAWIEILVMSLIMGALTGNVGFREFISNFMQTAKTGKTFQKAIRNQRENAD